MLLSRMFLYRSCTGAQNCAPRLTGGSTIFCKKWFIGVAVLFPLVLAGCTVQPLYANRDVGKTSVMGTNIFAKMAAITIADPRDRNTQILRNRLLYLLSSGVPPQESAPAPYQLDLKVNVAVMAAVRTDIGDRTDRTGRASAGRVEARVSYTLLDSEGARVARKQRSVSASFDRPRQEYANLQAEEDAKKRVLEELAEHLYLSLVQDLAKNPSK